MKRIFILYLIINIFLLSILPVNGLAFDNCHWGKITSGTYNSDSVTDISLNAVQLNTIEQWDTSNHFWFPINNGRGQGYFVPANINHTAVALWFTFETTTGEHSMMVWQDTSNYYFFPFVQEKPFATTPYNMGTHGCGDWILSKTDVDAMFNQVETKNVSVALNTSNSIACNAVLEGDFYHCT